MDVSLSGNQLCAGYASGKMCMYDIFKAKVIIEVDDLYINEVQHIKFLSALDKFNIVCSNKYGHIYKLSLAKKLLKFSCKSEKVVERPLPGICSIATLQPKEGMPYEVIEWESYNITAVASTENISIYLCGIPIHPLYAISRKDFGKDFIKPESICYLDWGYGITPNISRETSKCLLAIGWDKVLQVCILDNPEKGLSAIKMDGYYVSDDPIDSVLFLSDSVLMILVNGKEVRVLFIPSLLPGAFSEEGMKIKQAEDEKNSMAERGRQTMFRVSLGEDLLRDFSLKAEVEKGKKILGGNIRYRVTSDKQNYNNSIISFKNDFMVLGQDDILLGQLYFWEDYLHYIQHKCGWLVCLKAALDIYNGDLKGLYGVPYIPFEREQALIEKLKELIQEGISKLIKFFHGNKNNYKSENDLEYDDTAIKVAIEFCNEIRSFDFLFTTIFNEFDREGFVDKFVENLEPFVLGGFFKEEIIPDEVVKRIVDYYLEKRKYQILERIVSMIDLSKYIYLDELQVICMLKKLTTTQVHLIITSAQSPKPHACSQIIDSLINLLTSVQNHATLTEIKGLPNMAKEDTYQLCSTHEYIALKIMYLLKLYISGEKFPHGKMFKEMHQRYLAQCISFICNGEGVAQLIKVNARAYFMAIQEIFLNKSVENELVQLNDVKDEAGHPLIKWTHFMIIDSLCDIVERIEGVKYGEFEFCYFVIRVAICDCFKSNPQKFVKRFFDSLITMFETIVLFKKEIVRNTEIVNREENKYDGPNYINLEKLENEILDVIPFYSPFMDDDHLEKIVSSSNKLHMNKISIFNYEQRGDFRRCIEIFLESEGKNKTDIFPWLRILHKKKNTLTDDKIKVIEDEILRAIKDLVQTNSIKTSDIIDMWLPDQQKLVIKNLESSPDLQLKYLQDYLKDREQDIRKGMKSLHMSSRGDKEFAEYKNFLLLHVKLLADLGSPDLKEVVMRDYYPIDSLDGISDDTPKIIEARAYLKKRAEMFADSLKLFLPLIEDLSYENIKLEFMAGKAKNKDGHQLSFYTLFDEICDVLVKSTGRPDSSDSLWYDSLSSIFKIANKYNDSVKGKKRNILKTGFYSKISEFLQLMSKYVDFDKVIGKLLEIDKDAEYSYTSAWLNNIFMSRSDQEFLYKSAQRLLLNENSTMIDTIIEQSESGFKGDVYFSNCSLCKQPLGAIYGTSALILFMCKHSFHSKCYQEEMKNVKSLETRNKIDSKSECPLCRSIGFSIDNKKSKKKSNVDKRRRNRRQENDHTESSEENSSSKETKKQGLQRSTTNVVPTDEELQQQNVMMLKNKMAAFDEDYKAAYPTIPY